MGACGRDGAEATNKGRQDFLYWMVTSLVNLEEFDVENQGGVGRNDGWVAAGTVSVVRGDCKHSFTTQAHLRNTFVPAKCVLAY